MPDLDFLGKGDVYAHHLTVPFQVLAADAAKSFLPKGGKPDLGGNLIIQGDNLKALKALLPRYEGKVNCIYIDPPYNTGNEGWVYNDNVNSPMITKWLGKAVDGDDQCRHDKWLCMMWPRLQLLKELLADDGVIFISIDDNEVHSLRMVMDETFGEVNFMASFIWKSRQIVDSRPKSGISSDHEYIVAYRKDGQVSLMGKESDTEKYKNPDNDPRGVWMSNSILGLANQKQRPNLHYVLIDPKTGNKYPCPADTGWRYSKDVLMEKVRDGRIVFPKKKEGRPREKKFLSELTSSHTGLSSVLAASAGYTLNGTREVRQILEGNIFDFPKPVSLVKMLVGQIANKNAIILDSFAGSGATAQAVLELNKEDDGNRKIILVECEDYANKITAERVRRVIKGVKGAKDETLRKGLGGSFTYCTLGEELSEDKMLTGESLPDYETLAAHIFWTATGETLHSFKPREDWFIGESTRFRVYLVYKPDPAFLKSNDSALTGDLADKIAKRHTAGKKILVYAPSVFVGRKELVEKGIVFCQLPWTIHQRMGDTKT